MGGIVARECGVRNAECGISGGASIRGSTFHLHSAFRTPHSALLMSVQAIAWSPSGAVRIIDQRALPEARIERDLEDRKSTRLNSSHLVISYAVFCLKKKTQSRIN